eukprot:3940257-Rhodomonas_salina.1
MLSRGEIKRFLVAKSNAFSWQNQLHFEDHVHLLDGICATAARVPRMACHLWTQCAVFGGNVNAKQTGVVWGDNGRGRRRRSCSTSWRSVAPPYAPTLSLRDARYSCRLSSDAPTTRSPVLVLAMRLCTRYEMSGTRGGYAPGERGPGVG